MKRLFCSMLVAGLLSLGLSGAVVAGGFGYTPAQHDPNLGQGGESSAPWAAHSVATAQGLRGGLEGGVYIHRASSAAGKLKNMTGAPEVQKVTNRQGAGSGSPRPANSTAGSGSSDPGGDAGRAVAEWDRREMERLHKELQRARSEEFRTSPEAPQPIPTPPTWIDKVVDAGKKSVIINPLADPEGVPTIVPDKGFGVAVGINIGF